MGFWSDLGRLVVDEGKDTLEHRAEQRFHSDHIGLQNETVAYFGQVIRDFESGNVDLDTAIQAIQKSLSVFVSFASKFGSRGQGGIADVSALSRQIILDMQQAAAGGAGPGGGWRLPGAMGSLLPWVIGGAAVLYVAPKLLSGRR